MANQKISELISSSTLSDNGVIPIEQGGSNFKLIADALLRSDKLLSEINTDAKKSTARANLGTPSTNDVYTKSDTNNLFDEKAVRLKNDPSGFYDAKTEISLSWNEATRTLTVNKIGTSFSFFIRGIKYTKNTNESIIIPNTTSSYFIYYDLVSGIPTLQFQSTFTVDLILEKTYVAFLYWNATQSASVPDLQIETHGSSMSGEEHLYNHTSNGTAYISGLGLSFDTTGTGTADAQTRFAGATGVIADEDLQHTIPSKNSIDNFPIIYRFGTEWRVNKSNNLIGIKGTNYPFYNQNNAGNWQLTEMSANNYGIIYIFASPGITQKWFILMGQNQYGNINAATDASKIYPNLGNLPLQEFKLVGSAIFDVKSSYANTLKSAIQKLSTGADYYDWRKTSIAGQEASIMSSDIIFLQNQIDSKQAIPTDIKKLYVSGGANGSGNDSNNGFSELSALNTLAAANAKANGTGVAICLLPSQLTESITFTHANLQVSGFTHRANSGTSGKITADPASGSQTYSTLTIGTFEKIGANGCNLRDVTISTALNDTGSGFLSIINSDLSTIPLEFTGAGAKRLYNCRGGRPTVNNANAFVYIVNNQNVVNPTLTAGTLALENCIVYVTQGETLTLGTSGATISLNNVRFIYPDTTEAVINIPTGVLYSFAGTNLYKSTSTINGTDISSLSSSFIQNVRINTLNLPNRTASQRLETDANKNVVSVAKNTADNQNYSTTVGDIKVNGTGSLGSLSTLPRADHIHPTDTTREATANKVSAFTATPNNTNFPTEKLVKDNLDLKLNSSLKGAINGLAELGLDGKVPSAQLPAYVDDVLEYDNLAAFPATGETGKIYIAKDTNITYRWSGTQYVEISSSLALGETSSTAYRGDRGKIAYDHSQITTGNPHGTTKADIGLGNADNTSDATKNVLSASKLTTARNINGVSFDGTTDIVIFDDTKELVFSKNTAFNKNFGSSANTVTQGNDARLGTKNIDEDNIGNNRIQVYNSITNKLEYQDKPSGSTNLSIANKTATTLDIVSDNGNDATVPEATITEAGLLIATDKVKLNNTSGTNSGDQDLSGLLTKADNLNSVINKQTSLNNLFNITVADNGKQAAVVNGDIVLVAPSGGGNVSSTGISGATGKALVSLNDSMTDIGLITTAAQKQSYANSSGGTANLTTTERDLLTWANGDIIYNTTYFRLEKYDGTKWVSTDGTVGNIAFFDSANSPLHYQVANGSQVSRTGVYAELWALNTSVNPSLTSVNCTISIGSPALITRTSHGLTNGQRVRFTTTGALPTGITAGVDYIVVVTSSNFFNLATSVANILAGVYVTTTGTQSGTHSYTNTRWGQGNGTTTQNIADLRGLFLRGLDTSRTINTETFLGNGSFQADDFKSHTHTNNTGTANGNNTLPQISIGQNNTVAATDATAGELNVKDFFASLVINPTGGTETRPKNYTSTLYIKYL